MVEQIGIELVIEIAIDTMRNPIQNEIFEWKMALLDCYSFNNLSNSFLGANDISYHSGGSCIYLLKKKNGFKNEKKKELRELNVRIIQARNARRLFCYF